MKKLYKKYNEEFMEQVLQALVTCAQTEMNLKAVISVLTNARIGHIKKRSNVRLLLAFALRGVDNLKSEMKSITKGGKRLREFENVMAKYFDLANYFCLKMEHREALIDKFNEVFQDYHRMNGEDKDFNIIELCNQQSPLGYQFTDRMAFREKFEQVKDKYNEILRKEKAKELEMLEEDKQ